MTRNYQQIGAGLELIKENRKTRAKVSNMSFKEGLIFFSQTDIMSPYINKEQQYV